MDGFEKKTQRSAFRLEHWKKVALLLCIYDFAAVSLAYFLALWLRFDLRFSAIELKYLVAWRGFTLIYSALCVAVFMLLGLYKSIWRFAGFTEFARVFYVSMLMSVIHCAATLIFYIRMPISYYIIGAILQFILVVGIRFSYRFLLFFINRRSGRSDSRIMLIGAGAAGQTILRDINVDNRANGTVVCFIDDNPNKWGRFIDGVRVAGGRESILEAVKKYNVNKIFLAIPSASMAERRDILSICNETGCEVKNLPGIYQLVSGQITVNALKKVSIEDLLGRDPIEPDMEEVFNFINGKTVLVTGGGGSIGSELCRQIAGHSPKRLIIFDIYENNAYDIQLELKAKYPDLDLVVLIGSVRDSRKMYKVFSDYRPEIVYHAAAHKHVPLMETSPCEAIKNNTIGTYKTAYAAMMHGCERFVLISTDKAVNPTNIMGASKRLCEMIIQSFDAKIKQGKANEIPQLYVHRGEENADKDGSGRAFRDIKTEFVAVRFGNVLGSNGSVVPIFKRQIEKGGPVTVTHPDIIRYFMTVPEAVSLVMLAGTYAHGGEIFVLDMGSPVKIDTLARNLIRLSGLKPDVDIKVVYTGLRPGEKLYEEKLMAEEGMKTTDNKLIHIGCPIKFDTDEFLSSLRELIKVAYRNDDNIRELVERIVPTYHPTYNGQKILPDPKLEEVSEAQREEDNFNEETKETVGAL